LARPRRRVFMVVALREAGSVLLERRPEAGVWGGLWCLPQFATATAAAAFIHNSLGAGAAQPLAAFEHAFTHFDLTITPLLVRAAAPAGAVEEGSSLWYNIHEPARIGVPAPITALLSRLADESFFDRKA
jgi:A/G-specific adenine glycosylase